jgi:hypothetical protein
MKRLAFVLALCLLLVISAPALATTFDNQNLVTDRHLTYTTVLNLLPDSAGQYTELTPSAGNNWDCVNDPVLTPDDDATYVSIPNANKKDAYNLTAPTFLGENQTITSVTVVFRHEAATSGQAQPFLRLGSTDLMGTLVTSTDAVWATSNETLARPGGGAWTTADFASLQAGIRLVTTTNEYCTQVYVKVVYTSEEAQAPPFTLGEPPPFITWTSNISANFTTSLNPTFPLAELIQDVSDASSTPSQLPFTIIAGVVILACSLMFGWFLRRFGAQSLFVKLVIIVMLMGLMIAVQWLDLWILVIFIIIGIALALGSQTRWTATTG